MRPDQNELWERYEDAMFTLLMDEVAHQEGQEQLGLLWLNRSFAIR